jgi:hypothetical protein
MIMAITAVGDSQSFAYTGSVQEFIVPISGLYKLDVIGGGSHVSGGHAFGHRLCEKGEIIYVAVGGRGNVNGAFNGGGIGITYEYPEWKSVPGSCGGGATHMALMTGTLAEIGASNIDKILLVAGGSGGYYYDNDGLCAGGAGGGTEGGSGQGKTDSKVDEYTRGATQSSGNAFGVGASCSGFYGGGGGGGLYGGRTASTCSGSGGSGYIGGVQTVNLDDKYYWPGISAGGGNNASADGSATITLMVKTSNCPTAYLGDKLITDLRLGDTMIEDVNTLLYLFGLN